jgi:L-alanine-DL-glutamate epimerase-like enolase superfamily enzyme
MSTIARVTPLTLEYPEPNDNGTLRRITLCRLETADGIVGWGEAITMWPEACHATEVMIDGLSDLLIGRDPLDNTVISHEIAARAWWFGPEGVASFARSAIDIALWDLRGKVSGQSLLTMLGGAKQDKVPVIASTHAFMPKLEDEAERHASYTAAGFKGFKIGLGKKGDANVGYEFDRDVQFMKLLREAAGPGPDIMFDRGQHLRWDVGHAVKLTRAWEEYGLRWIEEPLEPWDIQGFRQLRSHCTSLVGTGERCWTTDQYHRLIASGIVDVIGCDPGRAGGITGFRELIAAVEHAQLWFNAHAWSSAIISAASLALSLSSHRVIYFELKPIDNPMQNDLITEPFWHENGYISGRSGPGLGIEVDERVVEKYRIRR